MTTKLTQKFLLKGNTEFEIAGEDILVRTKRLFNQAETLAVRLSVLNAEPVINKSRMEFVSRVNGEALVSLALAKPNVTDFNAFVNTLKESISAEYHAFVGMSTVTQANTPAGNINNEPPEFKDASTADIIKTKQVNIKHLEEAIQMLDTYVNSDDTQPLLAALQALKQAPGDQAKLIQVATVFNRLENQGVILTYAPYIATMLSDDPGPFA